MESLTPPTPAPTPINELLAVIKWASEHLTETDAKALLKPECRLLLDHIADLERRLAERDKEVARLKEKQPINTHVRLFDLVRQQRAELHQADLITEEEYAWLSGGASLAHSPKGGSPSPRRLEDYDDLRAQLQAATARAAQKDVVAIREWEAKAKAGTAQARVRKLIVDILTADSTDEAEITGKAFFEEIIAKTTDTRLSSLADQIEQTGAIRALHACSPMAEYPSDSWTDISQAKHEAIDARHALLTQLRTP